MARMKDLAIDKLNAEAFLVKATAPDRSTEVHAFRSEDDALAWCYQDAIYDRFNHFLITTNEGRELVTQFSAAGPLAYQLDLAKKEQ